MVRDVGSPYHDDASHDDDDAALHDGDDDEALHDDSRASDGVFPVDASYVNGLQYKLASSSLVDGDDAALGRSCMG